jgi:hypothetical protein
VLSDSRGSRGFDCNYLLQQQQQSWLLPLLRRKNHPLKKEDKKQLS